MHEIKELTVLFFDNILKEIGLETYEVLYNDPLHLPLHTKSLQWTVKTPP